MELRAAGKQWSRDQRQQDVSNGEDPDTVDMRRMGKAQEFRASSFSYRSCRHPGLTSFMDRQRNFKVVSITAFCVVTMMGWVFIPINAPTLIEVAGTGGCIVIFICNFFGFLSVVLSLAEMSSIAPTAGGQYHWTSEFAPPSLQRFSSYISGWLSSLSWLVGNASAMFISGNLIPTLISLDHSNFVPTAWQGYLFVVAICVTCFVINAFLARHLPLLEGFVFCFTLLAFLAIVIVLLVLSPKQTGSEVFQTFTPTAELGHVGALELVSAQVLLFYSLVASDSTAHMAEETMRQ